VTGVLYLGANRDENVSRKKTQIGLPKNDHIQRDLEVVRTYSKMKVLYS
jgi:hypothetical protein